MTEQTPLPSLVQSLGRCGYRMELARSNGVCCSDVNDT